MSKKLSKQELGEIFYEVAQWRKQQVKSVEKACICKEWCKAQEKAHKYKEYCTPFWKDYDTNLNFKKFRCGNCRRPRLSLVRSKWSDAEEYPFYGMLACHNENCKFYLIIDTDRDFFDC